MMKILVCKPFFRILILVGGPKVFIRLQACSRFLRDLVERTVVSVPAAPAMLPALYAQLDKHFKPELHTTLQERNCYYVCR